MTPPTLRDYQDRTIRRVRAALQRVKRVVLQSPTGSGKSVMIAYMIARAAERGLSAWLVAHRRELIDQLSATLWEAGVTHGVLAAGRTMTKEPVQVASIQTLVRRLDKVPPPDMLAVDECHHASATTYRKVMGHCEGSWTVGLTATPCRTDGAGLDDLFDELVVGPDVGELIERGYLAPYKVIAPPSQVNVENVRIRAGDYARGELEAVVDRSVVVGDAVEHYKRHVPRGAPCLIYCVSRKHARHVEEAYRAEGIDARYCAGDTPDSERRAMVEGFRRAEPPVIVSVDLFGEGLDVPGLAAVQLLRPTQSLGLHLQQIGRALRPEPGKTALILDHVGNTWSHGLPDDERDWSLEGTRSRKQAEEAGPALRHCEECFAIFRAALGECPQCGSKHVATQREALPDEVDGELEEIDPEEHRRRRIQMRREEGMARGLEALVELAKERGYKAAWAGIRHAARTGQDRGKCIAQAHRLWRQA